ncbi:MAG: L,D-transpeptidase [Myxococcaceae bacterium]|nr:L,D-transpeptidase [Myxococcaceae bacterium]
MLVTLIPLLLASADFPERCPSPLVRGAPLLARGQVLAPADGVASVREDGVTLTLCAYENHLVQPVALEVRRAKQVLVKDGARVTRGEVLAKGGLVLLDGLSPERFFAAHPFLYEPRAEPVLLVVDVEGHAARRFEKGQRTHTWEVGRGQAEGVKAVRGDLKTPRGLYFVTDKSTGPFGGDFAAYYGGHWVKVNYPNAFDAARGVRDGFLSDAQRSTIDRAWWRRELPSQKTRLGGGIGFHGWIAPWRGDAGGYGLSWGCVVLHPEDIAAFYASIPVGAAVVLE